MEIPRENEIKALVNSALCEGDLNAMLGLLVRARQLQPTGRLGCGYDFVVSRANPQAFYEQRRALILERFTLGAKSGIPPKISDLADEFGCSTSTVAGVKSEFEREVAA